MAISTTRTIGPLHFEDLEPHRFEDLTRQLIYDLRDWRSVEAIGRGGADDGIDILAVEEVGAAPLPEVTESVSESDSAARDASPRTRQWYVQCKRYKRIGPAKIKSILADAFADRGEIPYCYMLVAACDFSKKAREVFRETAVSLGIQEFHIWGKGELEDRLFMAKNDHLLFAYFGVSIRIRRRSLGTRLRSELALKRKLLKELGSVTDIVQKAVLIRDPSDEDYPYVDDPESFRTAPSWRYWEFVAHEPPGHLMFLVAERFAWVKWDTKKADVLLDCNLVDSKWPRVAGLPEDFWDQEDLKSRYRAFWSDRIPAEEQALLREYAVVPYSRVLAIDEFGDSWNEGPHLLVEFREPGNPFQHGRLRKFYPSVRSANDLLEQSETKHVRLFPDPIPDVGPSGDGSENSGPGP